MRGIFGIGMLTLVMLSTGACADVSEVKESIESVGSDILSRENESVPAIESMEELETYVKEEISQGIQTITFSSANLSLETIQDINNALDGFYGTVSECESVSSVIGDQKEYSLQCVLTDNYYVEQYILNGTEIPADHDKASALALQCQDILEQMKSDLGDSSSDYSKEKWIHDYLVKNTVYGYPEGSENSDSTAYESYGALVNHTAVCNGYAFAMKLLCDLNDLQCEIIVGSCDGENHAWNLVKLDGDWYHVDVTWDDPTPDQPGRIIYTYFNVDDERMSLGHSWISDNYPKAEGSYYNYYILNDLYCKNFDEFKKKCKEILEDNSVDHFQVMVGDYDGSIYSSSNMDFIFDYCDAKSMNYQSSGEIPYMTLYITLKYD